MNNRIRVDESAITCNKVVATAIVAGGGGEGFNSGNKLFKSIASRKRPGHRRQCQALVSMNTLGIEHAGSGPNKNANRRHIDETIENQ